MSIFIALGLGALAIALALLAIFSPSHLEIQAKKRSRLLSAFTLGISGIASLASIGVPFLAFFASILAILAGLIFFFITKETSNFWVRVAPAALGVMALTLTISQPLGLKVIMLPKADQLPIERIATTVVKTYDEGMWFESVRAGADGTLYLAGNIGLDFSRSDYYRSAVGTVIARKPDGSEKTLFVTPEGSTAGVIAASTDGSIFMTSNSKRPVIWRISPEGKGEKIAELPEGAWPNGLDWGPDGMLYSPDSNLGLVWRVDPRTGSFEKALVDPLLEARQFISLAPGANGLHFVGNDLIVTVSDRTTVLRYRLGADRKFSKAEVLATGIPGDDFAVGHDGTLFITTHPYNTLVRLSPDGRRTIIADAQNHIIGATDAVFGRGPSDRDVLYVVTDGGAFTGGPKTRGELVSLKPYAGSGK